MHVVVTYRYNDWLLLLLLLFMFLQLEGTFCLYLSIYSSFCRRKCNIIYSRFVGTTDGGTVVKVLCYKSEGR
jgi:hypothetical protein